jgi:hypothetical protein
VAVKFLLRNYKEGKDENAREDKGWADAEGKGAE